MHYLKKVARDALRDCIRNQTLSAKCYMAARLERNVGDFNEAAEWQTVAAQNARHAREAFDKWQRAKFEYETAKASLVKIDGEFHQRTKDGTRRLYTSKEAEAIGRAWADIF